jgi:hypothetical protein
MLIKFEKLGEEKIKINQYWIFLKFNMHFFAFDTI